jgi:hypothetical protein
VFYISGDNFTKIVHAVYLLDLVIKLRQKNYDPVLRFHFSPFSFMDLAKRHSSFLPDLPVALKCFYASEQEGLRFFVNFEILLFCCP